jgi:hypothetical protein
MRPLWALGKELGADVESFQTNSEGEMCARIYKGYANPATLADIHTLYACHDRLLAHKEAVFDHLVGRWRDSFNATFDVLLYDLTSIYFGSAPPLDDAPHTPRFAILALDAGKKTSGSSSRPYCPASTS